MTTASNRASSASEKTPVTPAHGGLGPQWIVRAVALAVADAALIALSYLAALWLRFDLSLDAVPAAYMDGYAATAPLLVAADLAVMWFFRLYHSIWRFASVTELARLVAAWGVELLAAAAVALLTGQDMPASYWAVGAVLTLALTAADRFSYRLLRGVRDVWGRPRSGEGEPRRVMVVGAGSSGLALVKEIQTTPRLGMRAVCALDDDPSKRGRYLQGVPIVGTSADAPEAAEKYRTDLIVVAMPSATGQEKKAVLESCQAAAPAGSDREVMVLPGIYQLVGGQVSVGALREVRIEDLLGRDPVTVNLDEVRASLRGRRVLVTGGGGSIGSELCRQIAEAAPAQLIIFDIYENNAYAIQQELRRNCPGLDLVTLIGSVRDAARLDDVFATYAPEVVFHAAAHKHVPLMEDSPREAVKNNVLGTYRVADCAVRHGAERFVLISTDKAVNPTNVMGATKRLCEMAVQMMDRRSAAIAAAGGPRTEFAAVRFGNVLGSNGSVIPLFERQIAEGGPVTVTDKRVVRYFMTIPEAVSLVLQASYYAHGGEIFVLDMGEQVRIDDMARKLIRLTGHEPDVDIKVVYTGLRPGEKLYEERLMGEEGLRATENRLISVAEPIDMDDEVFCRQLEAFERAVADERTDVRPLIAEAVPTYHPERGGAKGNAGLESAKAALAAAERADAAADKEDTDA